ncbi:hypothetical protein [Encephalitozoon cuniculi GB-M1]|uniref:UPF0328 protein ECU05_1640/ECU11_0090 n=1 Tax=Encephalitozoon cuniculi (strain GB-M1) TaxID=284813 RepID=Y5G4_ENCCU|nr:uncharacterized protein ECU11_0090 [Encephalitozoon cuniculi GB-M1]NP_597507.1 uncharacterized protein ECU05_1640 [Encephalitozoon cuniculi GB-M1]Q8STF1.1 RecName: Full=UPF0328 protein ECU05_1640/ECU11_0090 [Encephalitozoon cuniculi GB-M1]CAD25919.1 hypothetical protein [Encephalitozoon cuniculi GB-M1]CAD26684.1 hypothetical protein [Encephalitozoon cuniculi GB-M1]
MNTFSPQQHTENRLRWSPALKGLPPLVSIAFPALIYLIFGKDRFEENPFLKFITLLLPLSYSAAHHLFLVHTSWNRSNKPEGILHSISYYTLNLLLLTFATISILSIIAFPFDEWEGDDSYYCSIILPSFFMPSVYLLSTSCCLVPGRIGFTDTGINVPIGMSILLCPAVSFVLVCKESEYHLLPAILFPILILIRLFKEKCFPSEKNALPTAPWRTAIFVFILILSIFIYTLMARVFVISLYDYLSRTVFYSNTAPVLRPDRILSLL